jgi:hypothetical protein
MVVEGKVKVGDLLDSGVLYNNAEVGILGCRGNILWTGMAWSMDDDVLGLNLKHILSVMDSANAVTGRVWIEVYDEELPLVPSMCVNYEPDKCEDCDPEMMACWVKRIKSSNGGFENISASSPINAVE